MSGLRFLGDFVQTVDNIPHDISPNAALRIKPDLQSLVNKAHKAILPAQSKLNEMNNSLEKDFQEILVLEKNADDKIRKIRISSQQLKEKQKNRQGEVLEVKKQVAMERDNLYAASSFAQIKENQLNESKKYGVGMVVASTVVGGFLFGPIGAFIGSAVASPPAAENVLNAKRAVEEASARKSRFEGRLEAKKRDLANVKTNLEESEKLERKESEQLEKHETSKKEIKETQKQLAYLSEQVKRFTTLMDTTESRTGMMAIEANDELPDIEAMMIPLMAIASDLSETTFTIDSCLLAGDVDFKGIGSKIKMITSKTMKRLTSDDIDQWA